MTCQLVSQKKSKLKLSALVVEEFLEYLEQTKLFNKDVKTNSESKERTTKDNSLVILIKY